MHFDRLDRLFEYIVKYSSITVYVNSSVNVVTHRLIELNQNCHGRHIEIAFYSYKRNKVRTMIKQLKMHEYSRDTYFSYN